MEKSKVEVNDYILYEELYLGWLIWGLILLIAELFVSRVVLNRLP
jgi:hypothetical protein